jgi:hypothetical protein
LKTSPRHRPLDVRLFAGVRWPSNWSACWPWTGYHDRKGYGRISREGRSAGAHRAAYELAIGPIPDGFQLDHLCRNPPCINPLHLEPVTSAENTRRGETGINNRSKTHCPSGHPYDEANTYVNAASGARCCRICGREAVDRYRRKLAGRSVLKGG